MRINGYGMLLATCLWATLSFSQNYETWENAIKKSDLTFFYRIPNDDKLDQSELQGLLVLADQVIKQRENDIHDRKVRVYSSIALKVCVSPLIGCILDQRILGVILGIESLIGGFFGTAAATVVLAENKQPALAVVSAIVGLAATTAAIWGCVKLERRFWQKERCLHDSLEKACQDAVAIKARLTTLAAKLG